MNKILLIVSHLESGSDVLVQSLDSGVKLQRLNFNLYSNLDCLSFKRPNTEYRKRPKVYFDHILYNHEFSCKELFKYLNFIYVVGDPKKSLDNIVHNKTYDERTACNYYCFRVRRIYEMIKKSNDCLVFFNEDIHNDETYNKIHQMIGIKDKIKIKNNIQDKKEIYIDRNIMSEAERFYEKYRYKIKSLSTK
jgi:hypothetical protein